MSTTEAILEKVSALPPEKQEEVLEFVEKLGQLPASTGAKEPGSALRSFANLRLDGPTDASVRFHQHLYGERTF